MLVPLDLAALAWKQSHLSPELALGLRQGRHAHDCFDGLDQVRNAATGHAHTLADENKLRELADSLQHGCRTEYGTCWRIEAIPGKLAQGLVELIDDKRLRLKGQ